ncbi:SCO2521 family protein [Streptomyces prunicolor]|uniref:SCO2521 family protein n=1 Tax=Streptomyces prunicolor TaxID=67348 RepID=UPI0003A858FF|nr:SCO2521 family protein [Streptomyces prunicolor]
MATPEETTRPVLACGEVRTCLLPSSRALSNKEAELLLRLRDDDHVRVSTRPGRHVLSPEILTGVDCRFPLANRAKVRGVGTVASRAALTEGRLLQASSYFRAPVEGPDRRQPWGYYLARPGTLLPVGRIPESACLQGFLTVREEGCLDIGSIAEALLARISRHTGLLDYDVPLRSAATKLWWTARPAAPGEGASLERFTLAEDGVRTVLLRVPRGTEITAVVGLCEDLALHDWLLTTMVEKLDDNGFGSADGTATLRVLGPLVDHLLHLWMPGARVDRTLGAVWEVIEEDPGFSRQWHTLVQRVRDQLALQAVMSQRQALATG